MDRYSSAPLGQASGFGAAGGPDNGRPGLFHVLWRQRVLVIIPVFIMLALAGIYLLTEPTRYQSQAKLTITPAGSRLSGDTSDNIQLSNFLNTQGEKMMSTEILALALSQPVTEDANLPTMAGKKIRDLETFKQSDVSPLNTLRKFSDVSVGKKDDALTVSFESPVKEETPVIANAIVQAFMAYQTQPKHSSILGLLKALQDDKLKIEEQLSKISQKMGELEQKYGVLSNNGEDNLAFRQLAMISQQRSAAHLETLRAKGDAEEAAKLVARDPRLVGGGQSPVVGIVSADDEQMLRASLAQLQSKLRDMRAQYLPNHPAVRALQQRVDLAASGYAEAVHRRYLRAQAAEDDLNQQFEQQQKRAIDASAQAAQYSHLKDEADRVRHQLDPLDTRIHSVELQKSAGQIDIDFYGRADSDSIRKSHPSKPRAIALALILGLLLGCCVALTRDWVDDRMHSADEIKMALNMPILGAVPQMPGGLNTAIAGQQVILEPLSEVAEAFRSIRTAINFGAPKDRCKTLLLTSPTAGDGKSTAAANLAVVAAQAHKKVLLIDADLRNPTLNDIFNLGETRLGLSSLLSGHGKCEQAIQRAEVDGLDLLPSGPRPPNPSEMLNSPMFGELLEMLAEKYDQIIIDSPPVMGLADARIIAASCDLTILVLRAQKSTRKLAMLARDGLAGVGAHVLGVIVNDVSRRNEQSFEGTYGYPHASNPAPTVREEEELSAAPPAPPVEPRKEALARRGK